MLWGSVSPPRHEFEDSTTQRPSSAGEATGGRPQFFYNSYIWYGISKRHGSQRRSLCQLCRWLLGICLSEMLAWVHHMFSFVTWKLWTTWYYFLPVLSQTFGCNVSMVICTGCPYIIHTSKWLCAPLSRPVSRLAIKAQPSQLARRSAEIKCDLIPWVAN